jgi:hypothetical protein
LIGDVEALVASGQIDAEDANGILAKLGEAKNHVGNGRVRPATRKLGDFIDQVNALINSNRIGAEEGQVLIDAAQDIIDVLNA